MAAKHKIKAVAKYCVMYTNIGDVSRDSAWIEKMNALYAVSRCKCRQYAMGQRVVHGAYVGTFESHVTLSDPWPPPRPFSYYS